MCGGDLNFNVFVLIVNTTGDGRMMYTCVLYGVVAVKKNDVSTLLCEKHACSYESQDEKRLVALSEGSVLIG